MAEGIGNEADGLLARGVHAGTLHSLASQRDGGAEALPFISSASRSRGGDQGYDSVRVLAVGVDTYASSTGLVPLNGAEADAKAVAGLFRERGAHVTTLLGDEATTDTISIELRRAQALPGPIALLVVYFSGHGRLVTAGGEATLGAICLSNYDNRGAGEMLMTHLRDFVSASSACHKLVIFDCCYPGHGLLDVHGDHGRHKLSWPWEELVERPTMQVLAAAEANGYAYELTESGSQRGIFTRHLIDGLRGDAFEQRGGGLREWITLTELAEWVGEKVAISTGSKQRVQHGYPVGSRHEEMGQVIFVRPGAELVRDHNNDGLVSLRCGAVADEAPIGAPPAPNDQQQQQQQQQSSEETSLMGRMKNLFQVSSSVIVAVEVVFLGLYLAKKAWDSQASEKEEADGAGVPQLSPAPAADGRGRGGGIEGGVKPTRRREANDVQ
jgi:hypothetical protein